MKLSQLIQAYSFDELMPAINEMFPGTDTYREPLGRAYDIMLAMRPVDSNKEIKYKLLPGNKEGISYVGAEDRCFDCTWNVCLGKNVSKTHGVNLSDIQLLANCLVNMCLQGKYPREFEPYHRMLTKD